MKTVGYVCLAAFLAVLAFGAPGCAPGGAKAGPLAAQVRLRLSPDIPPSVDFSDNPQTLAEVQHDFDVFSWQSFVALNWPAKPDGSPDRDKTIGADGDNSTVWESYKEAYEVFLPDGSKPAPWGSPRPLPPACHDLAGKGLRVLKMTQKVSRELLDAAVQPFKSGPLVDQQNGRFVRFEVAINRDAFDYIVNQELYSKAGQNKAAPVNFPIADPAKKTVGSIILKSAWKVMGPADHPERFHTIDALVYNPPQDAPPVKESCSVVKMGLVGFHITHKTASEPQWVWSTFEHVDNVEVPPGSGLSPSFYNPDCANCPVNDTPPKPWDPDRVWPKELRSQVKRVIPIDDATKALNAQWQKKLSDVNQKSVWQYYQLISTQWPTAQTTQTGNPAPQFLANITLETYIQGRVPNVSSSCIVCHNNATTTGAKFSDFTYVLERAR